jgi:hypothetical protein
MSYGFGMFGIFALLFQIMQLILGIMTLKLSKSAGWMMIVAPIFTCLIYALGIIVRAGFYASGSTNSLYYVLALLPTCSQALFFAGVFMILLQAKAIKKRAEEQQMLLDEIASRQ